MGVFKDTLDLLKDLKDANAFSLFRKKYYSSLSSRAGEGTLQFPHIVSKNIDLETAQMCCKASERQLATFVQITMSMSPNLYIEDGDDAIDYIRQFHSNVSVLNPSGKDIAKGILKTAIEEGYVGFLKEHGNDHYLLVSTTLNDVTNQTVVSNKEQLYSVLEDLNTTILNSSKNFSITKENNKYITLEAKSERTTNTNSHNITNKLRDSNNDSSNSNNIVGNRIDNSTTSNNIGYNANIKGNLDRRTFNTNTVTTKTTNITNQAPERPETYVGAYADMRGDMNKNMLQDNDAKKANELVSTLVHMRIQLMSKDKGTSLGFQDFVLGVKATMHPVTSEEMITNLISAYKGDNMVFDFLRWTTGEIKFFRDFLFGVSTIKKDIANRVAGQSPLWLSAKRLRNLSKLNVMNKNNLYPNMTIVITKEEVDFIKDNYGINFMNVRDAKIVIDKLFLIDFIIVDEASKVVHFLFENMNNWESVSYSGLERENSRDERKFKEMLKALNR